MTIQEWTDGIREKSMRIASLDELGASSIAGRWSSSGEPRRTGTRKWAIVGLVTNEEDIVVASDSKSKLWKNRSLKRAIQNWNMKYRVDRPSRTLSGLGGPKNFIY